MSDAGSPRVSVIVCTRHNPEILSRCLDAILDDRSAVDRELIVVDNGPSEETRAVVERASARAARTPVLYVQEPAVGLSNARNRGVAAARGEVLAFTDDDVIVRHGWLDALVAPFETSEVGAVGGRIVPRFDTAPPGWLRGEAATPVTLVDLGAESRTLDGGGVLPFGANLAIRRQTAHLHDPPFEPGLGHRGKLNVGWEETYLLERIAEDYRIEYRSDAVVDHMVRIDGLTVDALRRKCFHLGFGQGRMERLQGRRLPSLPRRLVRVWRAYASASRARRSRESMPEPGHEAVWRELQAYMWAGKHVEMLVGRSWRLADWVATRLS